MENVSNRLSMLMSQLGLSPSRFSKEIRESRSKISQYIKGTYKPSMDTINRILRRYPNLNARWFISGDGEIWLSDEVNEDKLHVRQEGQEYLMQKTLRRIIESHETYIKMIEAENQTLRTQVREQIKL